MDVAFHVSSPFKKSPEVDTFVPNKFPKYQEADLLRTDAAVSLDPPEQIRTAPGCEAMPASRVPKKADHVTHEL